MTTAEAAERLGVKRATVYAYVSRGLLHPQRGPGGSTFDRQEVARLARSARHPAGDAAAGGRRARERRTGDGPSEGGGGGRAAPVAAGDDPVFVTGLTLIRGGLYYRGRDAVELAGRWSFERVAEWLWTGRDPGVGVRWPAFRDAGGRVAGSLAGLGREVLPVERFVLATGAAALGDELRHDLDPARVPTTGRRILAALASSLPLSAPVRSGPPVSTPAAAAPHDGPEGAAGLRPERAPALARQVWHGLSARAPSDEDLSATDAALVLGADHELAPSTLAARVAASFRADPYAVVLTGLGPSSGSWPPGSTGAPGEVEVLLERAAEIGAERAVGEHLRRSGQAPHGFGMPLYPAGDPRGRALLARIDRVGDPERRRVVRAVLDVGRDRGFPEPNFDMGIGALSFCAGMVPGAGQALFTLAKVAGWLAHAMEEYASPTRFRSRADYVGAAPEVSSGS